jgi:hypothetical protein
MYVSSGRICVVQALPGVEPCPRYWEDEWREKERSATLCAEPETQVDFLI